MGPIVTLQGCITGKDYVTILPDHVYSMVQYLFSNGDAIFQNDNVLFIHSGKSRIGFISIRMIYCISPDPHNHQVKILLSFCGLFWRKRWMITIHLHHSYLNLPLFCRKNSTKFLWKLYMTCIYPFKKDCKLFWMLTVFLHHIRHNVFCKVFPYFYPTPMYMIIKNTFTKTLTV